MQNLADLKCKIKFLSHMPTEKFCALFSTIEPFFTHDFSPKLLNTVGLFWTNLEIFSSLCSCRFFIAFLLKTTLPCFSQDKVKVARLDLFFLCVFPAFYVGFLLAYWIHFINRFSSALTNASTGSSLEGAWFGLNKLTFYWKLKFSFHLNIYIFSNEKYVYITAVQYENCWTFK